MQSLALLKTLYADLMIEAARNLQRSELSARGSTPDRKLFFKTQAKAQQLQAEKILLLLRGSMDDAPTPESDSESAARSLQESFNKLVMTAASDRQHVIESACIQMMKATASHVSLAGKPQQDAYHVCQICGHIVGESLPERCPVCRASAEQFKRIS